MVTVVAAVMAMAAAVAVVVVTAAEAVAAAARATAAAAAAADVGLAATAMEAVAGVGLAETAAAAVAGVGLAAAAGEEEQASHMILPRSRRCNPDSRVHLRRFQSDNSPYTRPRTRLGSKRLECTDYLHRYGNRQGSSRLRIAPLGPGRSGMQKCTEMSNSTTNTIEKVSYSPARILPPACHAERFREQVVAMR